ncbi:phosphotransferase enzyme family protein [Streptomyces sp. TE33382]
MTLVRTLRSVLDPRDIIGQVNRNYSWTGVSCGHLFYRASHDTYLVRHEGRGYVYKVFLPGHDEEAHREVDLTNHLAASGIGVAAVMSDRSGEQVTALRASEGWRPAVLSELVEGPDERTGGPTNFEELGRSIARLHGALDRYSGVPRRSSEEIAGTPAALQLTLARIEGSRHLPPPIRNRLIEVGARLTDAVEHVDWDRLEIGLIHGDLHQGNIRRHRRGNRPVFLDWELAGNGPRCADLAAVVWSLRSDRATAQSAAAALQGGYQEVRSGTSPSAVLGLQVALRDYWRLGYLLVRDSDEGFGWVLEAVAPYVARCAAKWLDDHERGRLEPNSQAEPIDGPSGVIAC